MASCSQGQRQECGTAPRNPVRGAADSAQGRHPGNGPSACPPPRELSASLSRAGRTMAAGGTVTMEPPAKMLLRPTLQLQVLAARPHPFCSKLPPRAVLQNPRFRIGQGVGMGTKGLESSISSEVSAWSAASAHLSPQPPLLSLKI